MTDDRFHFSTPIKVRFRDVDALGHVNNAVYFTYMEQARIEYLAELDLLTPDAAAPGFIIAEASCQFKAPIRMGSIIDVKVRVSQLGNSSFIMEYQLDDQASGQVMATGRTVNVAFDYAASRSVPLRPDWRAAFERFEQLA